MSKIAFRIVESYLQKTALPKDFKQWSRKRQVQYLRDHPKAVEELKQMKKQYEQQNVLKYKKEPKWKETVPTKTSPGPMTRQRKQSPKPSTHEQLEDKIKDLWQKGEREKARPLQRERSGLT